MEMAKIVHSDWGNMFGLHFEKYSVKNVDEKVGRSNTEWNIKQVVSWIFPLLAGLADIKQGLKKQVNKDGEERNIELIVLGTFEIISIGPLKFVLDMIFTIGRVRSPQGFNMISAPKDTTEKDHTQGSKNWFLKLLHI